MGLGGCLPHGWGRASLWETALLGAIAVCSSCSNTQRHAGSLWCGVCHFSKISIQLALGRTLYNEQGRGIREKAGGGAKALVLILKWLRSDPHYGPWPSGLLWSTFHSFETSVCGQEPVGNRDGRDIKLFWALHISHFSRTKSPTETNTGQS